MTRQSLLVIMRDALFFGTKVILGVCLTYTLLLVGIHLIGYQLKKAAVEKRMKEFQLGANKPNHSYLLPQEYQGLLSKKGPTIAGRINQLRLAEQ
jgi:hypothetical protein